MTNASYAGETEWQSVGENSRLRLVFSDVREGDGSTWAAVEIDMPPRTKTYWRVPGETGIPLTLDISGSQGINALDVVWPFPVRETDGGYLDYVYYGHVVLPIKLQTTGDAPVLEAEATLGICSHICVPVVVSFTHQLAFDAADTGHSLRIRQALAETPLPWDGNTDPFGDACFDSETSQLAVELLDSGFPYETTIADIAGETTPLGPGQLSADGSQLLFPVFANGQHPDLVGKSATLTFMTQDGPYEVTREVGRL
ncbi:protein-disulfide reductase DsbD domain-containing protein [Pelagibacterium halotolerans]|uniref:protein-disulfide reductase DsbD domain-containing protein n=1 Tax=Pelagibacterium halotolerans TaxID=531813 RepID=UPI00384B1A8E